MTPNESVINGIDILRKDPLASRTSVAALDCEQLRGQRQKRRGSLPSRSGYGRRSFPGAPSQPATRPAKETSNQSPPLHGTARQRSTHRSRTSGRNLGKPTGSTTKEHKKRDRCGTLGTGTTLDRRAQGVGAGYDGSAGQHEREVMQADRPNVAEALTPECSEVL